MNFLKGSLFRRNTEPEELEPMEESGGGILAVWGSPGCGKTVTAVKIAKNLAAQKKNTVLLLCDMTAPMMPCICPPSELEVDKSLGSIFAAQHISVNLIKHNLTTDGFIQWCKQIIGLCLTAFLQATILIAGLMVFKDHALLGLGLMLSAGEIPRIAGTFGLDTTTRANIMSAVYTAQAAVNTTRTIVQAVSK